MGFFFVCVCVGFFALFFFFKRALTLMWVMGKFPRVHSLWFLGLSL